MLAKTRYYGEVIGILLVDTKAQLPPGNVGNASTYSFPVRTRLLDKLTPKWITRPPSSTRAQFVEAVKEMAGTGVRAITTGCGFFAIHQKDAAESAQIPVATSPLLLVPFVSRIIGGRRVGIITANAERLTPAHLAAAGIEQDIKVAVAGLENYEEFSKVILTEEKSELDFQAMEREVTDAAKVLRDKHADLGAYVLECSDIPPFAASIQRATGLPVFDFIGMINLLKSAVVCQEYDGIM